MKTRLIAALAAAAMMFCGAPAFARGSGGGGHSFAGRGGGGGHMVARSFSGGGRSFASRGSSRAVEFRGVGSGRSFASTRGTSVRGSRTSVAFGGSSYRSGGRGGYGGYGYGRYRGGYGGGGWGYPWYDTYYGWGYPYWYDDYGPDYAYSPGSYSGNSAATTVQQDLAQQGYYTGPVDGIVGPMTRAAIRAYQRDNGLPVTGAINNNLMNALQAEE